MTAQDVKRLSDGGYDEGYQQCACFWGREPGSLVKALSSRIGSLTGLSVLDAGCGEGKNANYFAVNGAHVRAIDISQNAIANALKAWQSNNILWEVADIRTVKLPSGVYDIVVVYGLLHCLRSEAEIRAVISKLQGATKAGGYNLVCAFNARYQDLSAHPGFSPCLMDHDFYLGLYVGWEIMLASDQDLTEMHPTNNIVHTHSMTRLIARKIQS